ncbi:MAG: AMP-binding protein [Acidimicrobiales bacterium]|nr:AMP-binding protein [Acidimicrobiales bacterium]
MSSEQDWTAHLPVDGPTAFHLPEPGTLVGAWMAALIPKPDRVLIWGSVNGSSGQWVTRGEFLSRTVEIASRLVGIGLVAGDRVLLSGSSTVDLAVAHVACLRLGLVVVPTNGAYSDPELAHVVADSSPRAALVDSERWTQVLAELNSDLVLGSVVDPFPGAGGSSTLDNLLDGALPEDPAIIGYTSGTTGRPKGAVLTQSNLLAGAQSVRVAWRWTDADRLILCLPLFHMHGLGVGLHGTLLAGASTVLQPCFGPDAVLEAIDDHAATLFFGVPTMYHRLTEHKFVGRLNRLRLCVAGSAPLAADLHERLAERAGVSVLERYGMTETVMLVSNPYDGERRPGAVGIPLPGVELQLAEGDGEILVRGPSVFTGYWGLPEVTSKAFVEDLDGGRPWFRTGDLGVLGDDGYLSIVGRAKELIITGGLNVYPREVDDVLGLHPAVKDVAVAGVPSPEWGEEVVAWVVEADGQECPGVDELRDFARAHLAAYKLPRRVVIVDALPRNAMGKVARHELQLRG